MNWNSDEATRYMFRQDPAASTIRWVSCASTSRIRTASTCTIRPPRAFSATITASSPRAACACRTCANTSWILQDNPQWTRDAIDEAFRAARRIDARPREPIPVYWTYITAWATPDGVIQFRDDIYGKDGVGPGAVTQALREGDDRPD